MWRKIALVLMCMLPLTGCWDRLELNDRAILLGWGMDLLEDGRYLATANIVLPMAAKAQEGSGGSPGFLTESAIGKDITDAGQNMQKKLSRVTFSGHRRNIFIGENLAKHGIGHLMDEYTRSPNVRPRSNIFIVKNGTAQEAMALFYRLETNPSIAVQKIQEKLGAPISRSLLDFFIQINKNKSGVMPTIEVVNPEREVPKKTENDSPPQPTLEMDGIAIMDENIKLVGYLEPDDFWVRLWVADELKKRDITKTIDGKENTVSMRLSNLRSKVTPIFQDGSVSFKIRLTARGEIVENNTAMNVAEDQVILKLEQTFQKRLEADVLQVIKKVQTQYGTDVFDFGDTIRMFHPYKWKKLEPDWEQTFKQAPVDVQLQLDITGTGLYEQSVLPKRSRDTE
ncbi:Ger(x)C family spore germination protein [Paenibacillus physcomitrellae]|uniref:Spore germination protein KC n=1 Tax=Paenibacillus physcomitrellae TaxID=1619311 RepID=A0ABQ1FWS3_9BACL|nr:Ger(x)C family spore germination protein [Paenibacillus physcomitrellae]GGA32861.1 spore germination protein KC [Paenibacillus physcomitrellae]